MAAVDKNVLQQSCFHNMFNTSCNVECKGTSFGRSTSTCGFTLPLFMLMLQMHQSTHESMQSITRNSTLCEPIDSHTSGVNPEQESEDTLVKQFTEILDMAEQ